MVCARPNPAVIDIRVWTPAVLTVSNGKNMTNNEVMPTSPSWTYWRWAMAHRDMNVGQGHQACWYYLLILNRPRKHLIDLMSMLLAKEWTYLGLPRQILWNCQYDSNVDKINYVTVVYNSIMETSGATVLISVIQFFAHLDMGGISQALKISSVSCCNWIALPKVSSWNLGDHLWLS